MATEEQTLIQRYEAAATAHAVATERGDPDRGNRAFAVLDAVHRQLRAEDRLDELRPCLTAKHAGVRLWAGSHLLLHVPAEAEPVLQTLEADPGILGFDAQMTLMSWRAGQLSFP